MSCMTTEELKKLMVEQRVSIPEEDKIRRTVEIAYKRVFEELAAKRPAQKEIKEEELIDLMRM